MNSETKNCQACGKSFTFSDEAARLYGEHDLPMPVNCERCRMKHLLSLWIFGRFRKTSSALSGKPVITVLPSDVPFPIYDKTEFISDAWEAMDYGQDYDAEKFFVDQLYDLFTKVPHPHQIGTNNVD